MPVMPFMPILPVMSLTSIRVVCRLCHLRRSHWNRRPRRGGVFAGLRVLHVLDFRHLRIFIDSYRTYVLISVVFISHYLRQSSLFPATKSPDPLAAILPKNSPLTPLLATDPRPPGLDVPTS